MDNLTRQLGNFSELCKRGIERIWEENEEFQTAALTEISEDVRKINIKELRNRNMFYVPNDDYMAHFLSNEIRDVKYGVYTNYDQCRYYKRLVIPMYDFMDNIIGLVGYSNYVSDDGTFVKYLYSPHYVVPKSRYLYLTRDEFAKSIEDDYIFITDGIFDKVRLNSLGYNATSLYGSMLTKEHITYLSFIKHKIIIPDNDKAGMFLEKKLKEAFPIGEVTSIRQGLEWDIDEFLRSEESVNKFYETFKEMKEEGFMFDKVIRKKKIGA